MRRWPVCALLLALASSAVAVAEPPRPELTTPGPDGAEAPEGHLLVSWRLPSATDGDEPESVRELRYEVEYATARDFGNADIRRAGHDESSFLSGLPEGTTFVRVRAIGTDGSEGPWSAVRVIETAYPSARLVKGLMLLGAVTLLALVAAILGGHVRRERPAGESG